MDQNKETSAVLVDQNNPRGIEFHFCADNSFCFTATYQVSENHLFGWFEFADRHSLQAGNESTKSYGGSR